MSGGLNWWNVVKTYLAKFYAKYNLGSDLIDVANGDGGEVDVAEGRRRRVHRRHHRRFVELHALQKSGSRKDRWIISINWLWGWGVKNAFYPLP